ncbi:hypothetical protein B0O99DRAFT_635297 [Bisporella sp. PMI_857]|nr:hypothetical protein B0O99DRAFT_635297 [Bisporella sp. PMI_857]
MFAAGHLRTRRRLFHNTGILAVTPSFAAPSSVFPADICLHRQHEEDNANGLWVRNHMGDEWALYGDKELFSAKSLVQFGQNVKACQAGIDEVYSTFHTGLRPPPNDYVALKLIPRIDEDISNGYRNFAPLFRHNKSDPDHIYFRTNIDDRNSYDYTKYNRSSLDKELGHGSWARILNSAKYSDENQNLHPYTKEFRSSRRIIHVRKGHETEIIVNIYGSRDGEPWTMLAQTVLYLQPSHPKTTWASVLNPTPTVVILVGSVRGSPSGFTRRHVILSVLPDLSIRLVQDDIEDVKPDFKNINSQVGSMGESVIGQFARGSDQWALFTYTCDGRDRHAIDMYAILPYRGFESSSYSPLASQINTFPVGGQISHMITLDGPPWSTSVGPVKSYYKHNQNVSAFLALGFDAIKQKTFWFFAAWQVGAKRRDEGMSLRYDIEATTIVPGSSALLRPPNALLTHRLLQSSSSQCLVSIYSFLHGGELHVVVELWHADPNGYLQKLEKASLEFEDWRVPKININDTLKISRHNEQEWHINSGHNFTQHHNVSWNLIDVNQDGIADLVGLITDCGTNTNHTAVTVVLPGLRHDHDEDYKGYPISGFGNYVISRLVPDSPKWANRFMTPLSIHNVEYITSGPKPVVSQAGILMFFDNFGVLGVRLIAPVHGDGHDFKYELKGQTPAISGQVSSGLGWSPEDVMGTANSKKLIGILPLKD